MNIEKNENILALCCGCWCEGKAECSAVTQWNGTSDSGVELDSGPVRSAL